MDENEQTQTEETPASGDESVADETVLDEDEAAELTGPDDEDEPDQDEDGEVEEVEDEDEDEEASPEDELSGDDEVGKKKKKKKKVVQPAAVRTKVSMKKIRETPLKKEDTAAPEEFYPTDAPQSSDSADMQVEEDADGVSGEIVIPSPDGTYGIGIGFSETVEGVAAELTTETWDQVGGFFDGFKKVFRKLGAGAGGIFTLARKIARARVIRKLFSAAAQAAKNPVIAKMTGLTVAAFPAAGISPRVASQGLQLLGRVKQKDPVAIKQFAAIVVKAKQGNPISLAALENLAKMASIRRQMAAAPSPSPSRGVFFSIPSYYTKGLAHRRG